ncbi:hypothetical protein C1H76_8938 [Elsinoe australis]|uniref:Uncharacterized protein n=1 Tax=Elsinoe australis TaxID=40998 RepID=A0A4U7AVG9_9PEZI|nr:hypothetical protein C1H76_8938 [Elsinoe australis]
MHSFLSLSLLALVAAAPAPRPQDIEFDLVQALPNPTSSVATGAKEQIVTYDPSAILSSAEPQITADVKTTAGSLERRKACDPQPTGAKYAPTVSADTPAAFTDSPDFAYIALNAPVPTGYIQRFKNLKASNNAYGYMGFTTLDSYDTAVCAKKCTAIKGCSAFNIYFERDPSVDPAVNCANPSSYTMIKCVFWGSSINTENAVNYGQWRNKFQVVIAGSNGYESEVATPPGYDTPNALDAAINAPFDSYGWDSYMGVALFNSGPFDLKLCADACTMKSQYAVAHPPIDGSPVVTCQFFNTYIIYINNTQNPQGQYCAMYSESWPKSFATNSGQWRGADQYIVRNSYAVSNKTSPGAPCKDCAVRQASKDISWHSIQPYCSSVLGYSPATTTVTVTSTNTPTVTNTVTVSATKTANPVKRQDVQMTALPVFPVITAAPSSNLTKRAQTTPDVLTKYPTEVVSSACIFQIGSAGSGSTSTVTSTVLTTCQATTIESTTTVFVPATTTTSITTSATAGASTTTTATTSSTTPSSTGFLIQVSSGKAAGQYIGKDPLSTTRDYNLFALTPSRKKAVVFTIDDEANLMQGDWIIQGAMSGNNYGGFGASPYGFTNGEDLQCTIAEGTGELNCESPSNGHSVFGQCPSYSWMWMFEDEEQVNEFCEDGTGALGLKAIAV